MVHIALIRPGSTDFNRQGRIQGTLDIPLDEQGTTEVAQLIEPLRAAHLEVIYTPTCQPALETAEAISEALGIKLKKLDNMKNIDQGLWQGMLVDEVRHKHPRVYRQWQEQPGSVCPPEGEMLDAARTRVEAAMTRVVKKHKQGTIGLVVPEPLASLVREFLNHEPLGDLWKAASEHGTWQLIPVEPKTLVAGRK